MPIDYDSNDNNDKNDNNDDNDSDGDDTLEAQHLLLNLLPLRVIITLILAA